MKYLSASKTLIKTFMDGKMVKATYDIHLTNHSKKALKKLSIKDDLKGITGDILVSLKIPEDCHIYSYQEGEFLLPKNGEILNVGKSRLNPGAECTLTLTLTFKTDTMSCQIKNCATISAKVKKNCRNVCCNKCHDDCVKLTTCSKPICLPLENKFKDFEVISEDKILTREDTGKTFLLSGSARIAVMLLPVEEANGFSAKFIIKSAPEGFDYALRSPNGGIVGSITTPDVTSLTNASSHVQNVGVDTIVFNDGKAKKSDFVEVCSDGESYYVWGIGNKADSILITE